MEMPESSAMLRTEVNLTEAVSDHHEVNSSAVPDEWEVIVQTYGLRPMSSEGYLISAIYLLIVGVLATAGNSLVLFVFWKDRRLRRKPHNLLLLNLALSDIGISIFGYPLTTASNFAGRYLADIHVCRAQGFITFTLAQTDMNTLAALSFYRYVAVCKPHLVHLLTRCMTMRVIVFLWLYSLLWTLPPLLGWSSYTFEPFGTSCSIDWSNPSPPALAYTYVLVFTCYAVHLVVMVPSYVQIRRAIYAIRRRIRASILQPISTEEAQCFHRITVETRVNWMALIMTLSFVVMWSPYTFVCLWSVYDPELSVWWTTLPTFCAKATCMLNPVIYYMTNPTFRRAVAKVCSSERNAQLSPPMPMHMCAVDRTKDGVYIGNRRVRIRQDDLTISI